MFQTVEAAKCKQRRPSSRLAQFGASSNSLNWYAHISSVSGSAFATNGVACFLFVS